MVIQLIPIASIRKARQYIAQSLALPDTEQAIAQWSGDAEFDEVPEPDSLDALGDVFKMGGLTDFELPASAALETGQWSISSINPGDVLLKLPGLRLKPKMRLVGFVYTGIDQRAGIVWALPEAASTTARLEMTLVKGATIAQPPQPTEALPDFMDAIEGDRSAASFAIASILRRELLEFGARGPRCNWSHHRLIDAVPSSLAPYWTSDHPKNLSPKINQDAEGRTAVEFYTCRIKPPIAVFRHVDQYPPDRYTAKSLQKALIKLTAPS